MERVAQKDSEEQNHSDDGEPVIPRYIIILLSLLFYCVQTSCH